MVLMAGLLAWLLGALSIRVHQIQVMHAVCADHGEVIELTEAPAQSDRDPARSAPEAHDHDHGCPLDSLADDPGEQEETVLPLPAVRASTVPLLARAQAPRGPPLSYAPKTSPPPLS